MEGLGTQRAIGAVLNVNGETGAVKKFMNGLPPKYGKPTDRSNLHVTVIDPNEHTIDVITPRDGIAIDRALSGLTSLFHGYPIAELELTPASHELERIKNRYAVEITESDRLMEIRNMAASIMLKELGVSLSSEEYRPHMTVTRIRRISKDKRKIPIQGGNEELRIPRRFHIDGFDVGEKIKSDNARKKKKKPYINNPAGRNNARPQGIR